MKLAWHLFVFLFPLIFLSTINNSCDSNNPVNRKQGPLYIAIHSDERVISVKSDDTGFGFDYVTITTIDSKNQVHALPPIARWDNRELIIAPKCQENLQRKGEVK